MISPEELKLETNWFLKKITAYNAQPNVGIDEHMVKLFYETTQKIADCVDQNQIVNDSNNNQNVDILFDIDASCYRYHRSILCTICRVNIDINKTAYLAHVNGESHKRNISAMANGLSDNGNVSGSFMDAVDSAASLMMLSNGNGARAIATEEYFHFPSPMPRETRSATPPSTSHFARDLGQSLSNLSLNGAGKTSDRRMTASSDSTMSKNFDFIRNAVKMLFPQSKVFLYGSHNYGLADDRSDLNAYIDLDGNSYNMQRTKGIMAERQSMVEQKLKRDKFHWNNVMCDQRLVLYPLVRAHSKQLGVKCTFSFGTGLFVEANYLIKEYLNALPMAKSMILFLKNWQYEIQQSEANTFKFSTYQMTILVISYFQLWKYLPSVRSLQSSTNKLYCGDAQIDCKKPIKTLKPATNRLNSYLLDFFDFFGNQYNPRKDIISAYYGKLLKRNYTSDNDTDNWELCKYIKNANQSLWNEPHAHMYVHDVYLQSASPNVTADITSTALCAFRTHCKTTTDFLRHSMSSES